MSVVTSKSTMLSILKTSSTVPRTSIHKVRFQLPNNIRKIIIDFKTGSNTRDYENLVCTIRDSEINDSDLESLLVEAKNCTSLLNYDLRLFVQAIILVKWTHRSENVIRLYQEFINDLVSAHSRHTKLVVDQLVKLFSNVEDSEWKDNSPNELLVQRFNNIHLILQSVLTTIPMSESILLESMKHNFPYANATKYRQISYLYNLIKVLQYQPEIRVNLLQIAIDKLVLLDVQSPKEEILQYKEDLDDLEFEMEVTDGKKSNENEMNHPLANILDIAMDIMFQFIKSDCYTDGKLNQTRCHQLYNDLLDAFETIIFPTYACHHVQFIMFFICSFDNNIAVDFLKFFWKRITSPSVSPVIRQTSAAYLSSFLARADYLPLSLLKTYLSKLSEWIHNYLSNYNATSEDFQPDFKQHCVFYSICQALFYLIAFRHQDLINSLLKLKFLQSLNLPKIVSCKLNPLKFCLPAIVDNFAMVTRATQLAYCYTIIENNSRETIPIMGTAGQVLINPVIEVYFPFDPCVLLRVSNYINPLYREYKSVLSQEVTKITEKKQRLYSGTEDEDDFIEEGSLQDYVMSDEQDIT